MNFLVDIGLFLDSSAYKWTANCNKPDNNFNTCSGTFLDLHMIYMDVWWNPYCNSDTIYQIYIFSCLKTFIIVVTFLILITSQCEDFSEIGILLKLCLWILLLFSPSNKSTFDGTRISVKMSDLTPKSFLLIA